MIRRSAAPTAALVSGRGLLPSVTWGLLTSACGVGLLATSGWLITRAAGRPPLFVISVAVGAVQAFALGRGVFRYLQRVSVHDVSLSALGTLRLRLYDQLEPLVPGRLPGRHRGDVLSAFVADTEEIAQALSQAVTAAVDVLASVMSGVLVALLLSPVLAGMLALGSVVVVLLALLVGRSSDGVLARAAGRRAELTGAVVEAMAGARELVAYGRQDLVEAQLASVRRRSVSDARRLGLVGGLGRAAATWSAGAVLMALVGVGLAVQGPDHLSGVELAVVVFAAMACLDQITGLPAVLADTASGRAAAGRLRVLSDMPAPAGDRTDVEVAPGPGPLSACLEDAEVVGADGSLVLDGVSFEVPAGSHVALVGRSGAGKTSALYAWLRFLECRRGRAVIGDVDVSAVGRSTLAECVGWTGEEAHVFSASVADNLRLARSEATAVECAGALRRVGLGSWLASLPDGLDTRVGAGGRHLSAGERQRLSLARSVLAGSRVVLLDEPTAHVDSASSGALLGELLGAAEGRTTVVVTHDLEVATHVDEVMVLDRGRRTASFRGGRGPASFEGPLSPAPG